jgi:hypothetical protein
MTPAGLVAVLVLLAAVGALAGLTAIGERRRGGRFAVAILAGLFFPLAWVAWYAHDELPAHRS